MKKIIKQPITKKPTKKIRKKAKLNFDKVINVNQATISQLQLHGLLQNLFNKTMGTNKKY